MTRHERFAAVLNALGLPPTSDQAYTACPVHGGDKQSAFSIGVGKKGEGYPVLTCHTGCPDSKRTGRARAAWYARARRELVARGVPSEALAPARGASRRSRVAASVTEPIASAPPAEGTPPPDRNDIERWNSRAYRDGDLTALAANRGLSVETLDDAGIGWDGRRYTVPVYHPTTGELTDLQTYRIGSSLFHRKGGTARLYAPPAGFDRAAPVLVCEGIWDVLAARQYELNAVGVTGGAGAVPKDLTALAGCDVAVVFDCDDAGRKGAAKLAKALHGVARSVRVADLGLPYGGDVRDWFVVHQKPAAGLLDMVEEAEPYDAQGEHEREMFEDMLARQRVQERVRVQLRQEKADAEFRQPETDWSLKDSLAKDLPPLQYTFDRLHPTGGSSLIAAQYKVGKTVLGLNLARCYADDVPFLGQFDVNSGAGRIAYLNFELTEEQFLAYVRPLGIENPDRISPMHLRGKRFDLRSPSAFAWAAKWLRDRDCTALVVDPFGAAARLTNENDNSEARLWLLSLDELKEEAGVKDLWLMAHTGRGEAEEGSEHVRGASAVDDWADVRWTYTRQGGSRFLRAGGRGVEVPEFQVGFDRETSHLHLQSTTGRTESRAEVAVLQALSAVIAEPGVGSSALRDRIEGDTKSRAAGIRAVVERGYVRIEPGKNNAKHHFVTEEGEGFHRLWSKE